jgi:F0F1-type ATP synthase membrane subunit b/b'
MVAAAQADIAAEREAAEVVLRAYTEELAEKIASRVLGEPVRVSAQHRE